MNCEVIVEYVWSMLIYRIIMYIYIYINIFPKYSTIYILQFGRTMFQDNLVETPAAIMIYDFPDEAKKKLFFYGGVRIPKGGTNNTQVGNPGINDCCMFDLVKTPFYITLV